MMVSLGSLHVENQSLLGSERKGMREKYQGHVSNAWTISGVVIMVFLFLCYKRQWIPKAKTKGPFAFK